ncbi:hypothetical protein MTO96_026026 [Rhipicephalus appendiculatus]
MPSLLQYQDLPGGPTFIKFADEVSRHCICSQCDMISLRMYQDVQDHVFCEHCLVQQSMKHGKSYIFCTHEHKNVELNEMFEARDVVTVVRDQYVDCPNQPNCNMKVKLEDLHDHYVSCKQRVQCPSCDQSVETKKWRDHPCTFETHQAWTNVTEDTGTWTTVIKMNVGENRLPILTQKVCKYCHRRIKDNDVPRHLKNCTKAPQPCVYCETAFRPDDMTSHIQRCYMNPDNATKTY